jgi:hypothetical protein
VQAGDKLGELHRPSDAAAISVIDQLAGAAVVDDAVVGVLRLTIPKADSFSKAPVSGMEAACYSARFGAVNVHRGRC